MSPLSPLTLPWATLRLAGRFFVPLALWYTVGQLARWALGYAGYEIGLKNDFVPLMALGITVLVTLTVTVAMFHSVREGLPAIRSKSLDATLAPWRAQDDESLVDAVSRSLFPFLIFYLAWGILTQDARDFAQGATSRGLAQGGLEGGTQGLGQTIAIEKHMGMAVAFTVVFFILKAVTERVFLPRYPRPAGIVVAVFEINWTLFALFTVVQAIRAMLAWITGRAFWTSSFGRIPDIPVLGDALGWLFGDLWPMFMDGVLLTLVWLVIAGVVLGVHLNDEDPLLARSRRLSRAHARLGGLRAIPRDFLEELSQELFRERWVPALNGIRLIRRAGVLSFAVLCVLYTSLSLFDEAARRMVYELMGPESIGWWAPRAGVVGYGVGVIAEILRVCLLAAAFDLVVARAVARSQPPPSAPFPSPSGPPPASPPGFPPGPPAPAPHGAATPYGGPPPVPAGPGGPPVQPVQPVPPGGQPFSARSAGPAPRPSA